MRARKRKTMSPPKARKPFVDNDGNSLLDDDERNVFDAMRKHHKESTGRPLSELEYADIALRGAAVNYVETTTDDKEYRARHALYAKELRRAAVLYVRCALLASDNGLVESWMQSDAGPGTIQTLDDLRGEL